MPSIRLIAIAGPTASGKSDVAILLAKKYNGEIISVDSRQVYRGLDIGSGKVTKTEQRLARHHLLDIASPKRTYTLAHFLRDAKKTIADIESRGKLPILCGGTHFWMQSLIENVSIPKAKPNQKLRSALERKSTENLFSLLQTKDPVRARSIDSKNRRRLIRALEICDELGSVPLPQKTTFPKDVLLIAINPDKETLRKNIQIRLEKRLRRGMLAEGRTLLESGVSQNRLESLGLEYRFMARLFSKKIDRKTFENELFFAIWHFAKRQLTWLRRWEQNGAPIHWCASKESASSLADSFLKKGTEF